MKDYNYISQHGVALKAAQDWVKVNSKPNVNTKQIWHYEYKITPNQSGFHVFVTKYTLGDKRERQYYPGAHFSLDIDINGKIRQVFPGL